MARVQTRQHPYHQVEARGSNMIEITALGSSSKGNCYRITDGITPLLLECGIRHKEIQRKLDFKTSEIKACLVSHEHKDHSRAIADILKSGIDVYCSRGTANSLNLTSNHRIQMVDKLIPFTIGTWTILPFETQHDAAEPLGFLMANAAGDKLLFATDTYYIKYRFNGLTHVMLECNYAIDILRANVDAGVVPPALKDRIIQSHFSLENVKGFLRANDLSRVQEIWLIHLSDDNSDTERFKREIQMLMGKPVRVADQ